MKSMRRVQTTTTRLISAHCPDIDVDLERGQIRLKNTIHFWAGTADIKPESYSLLRQLKIAVRAVFNVCISMHLPPVHLRVEGHVHKTLRQRKCWRISGERAQVIVSELVQTGVPSVILHPKGFGASKPLGNNQADRRV